MQAFIKFFKNTTRLNANKVLIILFFVFASLPIQASDYIGYQAQIIAPDGKPLTANLVQFIITYRNAANDCTIYREQFTNVDMSQSAGLVVLKLGNGNTSIYAPKPLRDVFSNQSIQVNCEGGGSRTLSSIENRILFMQFNDGTGWQTISGMSVESVPYAWYADDALKFAGLLSSDYTKKSDIPGCNPGEVLTANTSGDLTCVVDASGAGTITSVTASGPLVSSGGTTPNITITQASGGTSGYLSSADWTIFNNKLSNFSTMTSADIISALSYTPTNSSTAVTSVAGRTGTVTLSSADISGLGNSAGLNVGTGVGTVAAGNDARFTDERTPINNSVTSAKILDGTIVSADIANSSMTLNKLNQDGALSGQVIKWNGSAWVASQDNTSSGTVTSVTAGVPLSSSGGTTPNITISQASGTTAGYLSSSDWTTFSNKLSDFSTMTSADIITALTYTPANSTSLSNYVLKTGDTMTGALNLPNNGLSVGTNQLVVSGGNIGIGTSTPATKLTVSGGNISSPNQTFFEAKHCSAVVPPNSAMVWETEITDTSAAYNNATGIFTAPVSGVYQFGFNTLMNYSNGGEFRYGFFKNGAVNNVVIAQKAANQWQTIQGTWTTQLNAGDTVKVEYMSGTGNSYTDCNFNRFWGRFEN